MREFIISLLTNYSGLILLLLIVLLLWKTFVNATQEMESSSEMANSRSQNDATRFRDMTRQQKDIHLKGDCGCRNREKECHLQKGCQHLKEEMKWKSAHGPLLPNK